MKTFFLSVLLVFVLMLTVLTPTLAQEESACTSEQWGDFSTTLNDLSDTLATSETPMDALLAIQTQIETMRAACGNWVFTKADYANGIIGPISFDGTLYQATLESVGSVAVLSRVEIDGDCDFIVSIITPFTGGEESDLLEFDGCTAMLEIDSSTARDWTLTLTRLK